MGLRDVGRGDVADDEHLLARRHHVEIAPCDFLDRVGIFAQPPHLVPQARVLGADASEFVLERLLLAPRL